MKSIEEHNRQRQEAYEMSRTRARKTGIACPSCGGEMLTDGMILMSNPPKKRIYCEPCKVTETVYA